MNDKEIRVKILQILLKKYIQDPLSYYDYYKLPNELGCDIETTNRNAKFLIDEGLIKELPEKGHHPYLTGHIKLTPWGFEKLMELDENLKKDFEKKRTIIMTYLYEEYKKDPSRFVTLSEVKEKTNLEINEINYTLHYLDGFGYVKLRPTAGCAPYIARYVNIEHEGIKRIEIKEDYERLEIKLGEKEIKEIRKMLPIARCFKSGADICPKEFQKKENQVFVEMPFKNEFKDSYEFGIKPALEGQGFKIWKADEEIDNIDVMCKVCHALQESSYAIINISDWNPNVMYELGLAHGLGVQTFIIKMEKSEIPTDLKGLEYISYSHSNELRRKLESIFSKLKIKQTK